MKVEEIFSEISKDKFVEQIEEYSGGDEGFLKELSGLYALNYEEFRTVAPDAIMNDQEQEYRNAAHKLSASNQTLGLMTFEAHLKEIKEQLADHSLDKESTIQLIRSFCEQVESVLLEISGQ